MTLSQLKELGVRDERWTVHDKLQMYKGLIRIYNREQKNQVKDTNVLKKKNFRKIANLQKEVEDLRKSVALTMDGDKTIMRRALQNYKDLQLTYQDMEPDKVVEDLTHRIFCRRKYLNVIRYKKSKGEEKILENQVLLGDLSYLIQAPGYGRSDLQQQAITNQIQNYVVKFCAAKNIQNVYKRMLAVLHKDQRYYEAILVTLQNDSNIQHKCLIRATEMGQLAMEDMANMRAEYTRLEKEVRFNMIERERCLKEIRDRLVDLYEESQGLVRTESEFDMQMMQEEPKKRGRDLEQEVRDLDELLLRMQDVTLVPKFSDIFPRMLETLRQKKRLLDQLQLNAAACDSLLNKKNHGELMYYSLYHTGAEAAAVHSAAADDLKNQIQTQKGRLTKIVADQGVVSKYSVNLRVGLQRLCQILEEVKLPKDYTDAEVQPWPVKDVAVSLRPKRVTGCGDSVASEALQELPPINEDAQRLIHLLDVKMKYIRSKLKEIGEPAEQERAFTARFKHVTEKLASQLYPEEEVVEAPALILDIVMEDPQVPNRLEIKARSHEIYVEATRNPYEVVEPKKKSKKKKK